MLQLCGEGDDGAILYLNVEHSEIILATWPQESTLSP